MPINYQQGKIYKITNTINNIVYVGSTAQPYTCNRMSQHRARSKTCDSPIHVAMKTLGAENFNIHLHHAFPCNSKAELEAEEYKLLKELIVAGTPVYNTKIDGKNSDDSFAKLRQPKPEKRTGCVWYAVGKKVGQGAWCAKWWTDGILQSKSFAETKYGYLTAKRMAEDLRQSHMPEWQPGVEQAIDDLCRIDADIFG